MVSRGALADQPFSSSPSFVSHSAAEVPSEAKDQNVTRYEQTLVIPQFLDLEKLTASHRHGMCVKRTDEVEWNGESRISDCRGRSRGRAYSLAGHESRGPYLVLKLTGHAHLCAGDERPWSVEQQARTARFDP